MSRAPFNHPSRLPPARDRTSREGRTAAAAALVALLYLLLQGASLAARTSGPRAASLRATRVPAAEWVAAAATSPTSFPTWTAEGDQESCKLGYSVSGSGDVNGDGFPDVVLGAPLYDTEEGNAGLALAFYGGPQGLPATPSWSFYGDQNAAELGVSVARAGDVDGDGFDDVIVGSSHYDGPYMDSGRIYLFRGGPGGLQSSPSWIKWGDIVKAHLGRCVAGAGDVNSDGFDDVIVGSFNYRNPQVKEGRAYLFLGGPDGLADEPSWTAEGNQEYAYFAMTVAGAGDVDGDGFDDVIVGAPNYDVDGLLDAGRVYVFLGDSTGLSPHPAWILEGDQAEAHLGRGAAAAGDLDGDGYDDIIVGAPDYDGNYTDEGLALLFRGGPSGPEPDPIWSKTGGQGGARFGHSLAAIGDTNGDGRLEIAVGANGYENTRSDEGRVFIYSWDGDGLSSSHIWHSDGEGDKAEFGFSVAGPGDVDGDGHDDVLVGAPGFSGDLSGEGRATLFYMGPDSAAPAVDVLAPDGGEVWYEGGTYEITWTAADESGVDSVDIHYSPDGGDTFAALALGEPNDGVFAWTVPAAPSESALVMVVAYDPQSHWGWDVSEGFFSIRPDTTGPAVTLTAPNGAETWYAGSEYEITWVATDETGVDSVSIYFSTDGGANYSLVASGEENDSTYTWTVPEDPSPGAVVKIVAYDSHGNASEDESDAPFSIEIDVTPPSVTVLSPNGGEEWPAGSTRSIEWVASDANGVDSVRIYYSTDAGSNYSLISSGEANDSSYAWVVPEDLSDACLVRVEAYDRSGLAGEDAGDALFSIVADTTGPSVTVLSPNGGETWGVGNSYPVEWHASDEAGVDSVSIYYSLDGGASYELIASGEDNDSLYVWEVPPPPSDSALIRVVGYDAFGNTGSDESDSLFALSDGVVSVPGNPRAGRSAVFWGASPSPFNDCTWLTFYLPDARTVRLEIFDAAGRRVATLIEDERMGAGVHRVPWDGSAAGRRLGTSIFFCRFSAGDFTRTSKLVLAR